MNKITKTLQFLKDSWKSFSSRQKLQVVGIVVITAVIPLTIGGIFTAKLLSSKAQVAEGLKSNFFKTDQTALSVLAGNNYTPEDTNLKVTLPTGKQGMNTLYFEFKLINAFKQLGYNRLVHTRTLEEKLTNAALHKFQKINNLPVVDYLDKPTLLRIDDQLFQREQKDTADATLYPAVVKFIDSPNNEPPNSHLASLYYNLFSSLPVGSTYPVLTLDDFRTNLIFGLGGNLGKMMDPEGIRILEQAEAVEVVDNKGDFKFCSTPYFAQYSEVASDSPCIKTSVNYLSGGINIPEDYYYLTLLIHEYGHGEGTEPIVINNETVQVDNAFGRISFDMSIPDPITPMYSSTVLRPSSGLNEFVSGYAKTLSGEDFAESYTAYVIAGRIFREQAKLNPYLNEKYVFLKDKVFGGKEYDTGSLLSYSKWNTKNTGKPWHPEDYMYEDDDWIWDNQYPIVNSKPVISTVSFPVGRKGKPYSATVTVFDVNTADRVAINSNGWPVTINNVNCNDSIANGRKTYKCIYSGTPIRIGTYSITITANDGVNGVVKKTLTLTIK